MNFYRKALTLSFKRAIYTCECVYVVDVAATAAVRTDVYVCAVHVNRIYWYNFPVCASAKLGELNMHTQSQKNLINITIHTGK